LLHSDNATDLCIVKFEFLHRDLLNSGSKNLRIGSRVNFYHLFLSLVVEEPDNISLRVFMATLIHLLCDS